MISYTVMLAWQLFVQILSKLANFVFLFYSSEMLNFAISFFLSTKMNFCVLKQRAAQYNMNSYCVFVQFGREIS